MRFQTHFQIRWHLIDNDRNRIGDKQQRDEIIEKLLSALVRPTRLPTSRVEINWKSWRETP